MSFTRTLTLLPASIVLLIGLAGALVAGEGPADSGPEGAGALDAVLERFDEAQRNVRTLTAGFEETKEMSLLREPVVSRGKLYYTRPDDILWEYLDPSPRIFLIRREVLLAYYPGERRAERMDTGRSHDRLLRTIGIGQLSEDLRRAYDISLAAPAAGGEERELVLSPRRRRLRKRLQELRFRLDPETALPVRLEFKEADGDRTTIVFSDIEVNGRIDEATYRIELPPGVRIEETFRGIGSVRGAS